MRWSLFALLFLAGCGGASTPAAETASPAAPSSAAASGSVASAPKSRVWGLLEQRGDAVGYLDAKRFVTSAAGRAVLQSLSAVRAMQPGADPLAQAEAECGFNPLDAVAELSFTADQRTDDALVAVALQVPADRVMACLGKLGRDVAPVTVAGRSGLGNQTWAIVPHGDLLLIGKHAPLAKLLATPLTPSGAPPTDDYLSVTSSIDNPFGARRMTLALGPAPAGSGTRIGLNAQTASPEAASALEGKARQLLALVPARAAEAPPEVQRVLGDLLKTATITRTGNDVAVTVTVDDETMQGALVALAVYGVRRYVANAKIAEARATVYAISTALEETTLKRKPRRFPRSAPLVPKAVPAGTKYASTAADWQHASWTAIGFSKDTPQYYAYEYETSKDGSKATVRARGDLDGDGVESRFELDLIVDKQGAITRSGPIREQDPTE